MPDLLMLEDVPEGQAAEVVVFTEEERDLMPTEPPMVQGQEDYEQEGGPRLLLVDSRPEFMQLPLHFQGFCCWTLVKARGLLVSGRPSLGVVQYGNAYYVFAHQVAFQRKRYVRAQYLLSHRRALQSSCEILSTSLKE
jgi:hypothetical protein